MRPVSSTDPPRPRALAAKANRRQMLLFATLPLLLTIATVWGGRVLSRNSEALTFAVGDPNGDEARFAAKLATVLETANSWLRPKIVRDADDAKALPPACGAII
jgi:hypothetical protein